MTPIYDRTGRPIAWYVAEEGPRSGLSSTASWPTPRRHYRIDPAKVEAVAVDYMDRASPDAAGAACA